MGKPNEGSNPAGNEDGEEIHEPSSCSCNACASSICTGSVLKCVVALVLSLNLLAFGVWSLPIFGKKNETSGESVPANNLQAQIQASFRLQKPFSAVNANILKLEAAIWEEISVPSAKAAVTSIEPLDETNSTEVIFDVLPDTEHTNISSYGLFLLRETFITLLSGSYNLSLKSQAFGDPYFFQLLKFPGGITVVPKQKVFPLQQNPVLLNFTLHGTIAQVVQNLNQLRKQLSIYLRVRPNENVFVQLTNMQGSTVNPPTIVETFIVPVVGRKALPTPRLRQLAHQINPSSNLGLNHTLFGKVKQIQLSSYLRYPSSPPPYHLLTPVSVPSESTFISPTHSTPPSYYQHVIAPSPHYAVPAPVSHHHARSPCHRHGSIPYCHHVVAPSSYRSHVHCNLHHGSNPVKCRHKGHAPVSWLNGEAPSPSPGMAKPFGHHHHQTVASAPHVITPVTPSFSPRNGPSPQPWHLGGHSFPSASPAPSLLPYYPAPNSAPPTSSGIVSSPKSSHLSPEGLPYSPSPKTTRMSHPDLPEMISPAPAVPTVSSSSYCLDLTQLIISSLILAGTVYSVLA